MSIEFLNVPESNVEPVNLAIGNAEKISGILFLDEQFENYNTYVWDDTEELLEILDTIDNLLADEEYLSQVAFYHDTEAEYLKETLPRIRALVEHANVTLTGFGFA